MYVCVYVYIYMFFRFNLCFFCNTECGFAAVLRSHLRVHRDDVKNKGQQYCVIIYGIEFARINLA